MVFLTCSQIIFGPTIPKKMKTFLKNWIRGPLNAKIDFLLMDQNYINETIFRGGGIFKV